MRRKKFKWWVKKEDGTTAIEFSLLALPFMFTVISIIELSLFFVSGSVLEGAVADASRVIRTGQAQTSGDPFAMFMDELCDHAGVYLDCNALQYQVQRLDDFGDDIQPNVDDDANLVPGDLFNADDIQAGCVALVRVSHAFQFMTPLFAEIWGNYGGNRRLQMATVVFRAEPFDFEVNDPTCRI